MSREPNRRSGFWGDRLWRQMPDTKLPVDPHDKTRGEGLATEAILAADTQLWTLLLSDLVDSTRLVEQLGDSSSAELFRHHDRKARDLLEKHRGREIDKTDGFLLLFQRPWEAVRYALDYHRALAELSKAESVELAARVGIHFGEVILRRNPPQDVARGAKPLEAEGLAKPTAARLMSLARGRQTLLTHGAFDLARRSAVGQIENAESLHWLAHGGYLFKGVREPVEVYEVGFEGFAPLSAPVGSRKAVRVRGQDTILGWRPAPDLAIPHRKNWVVEKKLGEGGFGEVWLAANRKLHEHRVFKFCYEAERLRSLQREITVFRLLKEELGDREDIARILDWNFEEAPYFIESAYTEGGNLIEWAEAGGGIAEVPLADRLEIAAQVADALAAAHSVGVLHKDVKPANVLIKTDGSGRPRAVLTDFGIGLITDREKLESLGITVVGVTEVKSATSPGGSTTGTALYLAPELIEGKAATVQADVYALGVLLYQVAVGDLFRALGPGWERDVDDAILREDIAFSVDVDPNRRLGNARRLAERLRTLEQRRAKRAAERRMQREAAQAKAALERSRRRRKLVVAAVAALVLFAVTMAFQVRRTRQEAERANAEAQRAEREAETARQVSDFLENMFQLADPSRALGNTITAREILERGAAQIENELADQPEVQARMMDVMGGVYMGLGLWSTALPLLEGALERRRDLHGEQHPQVAESLNRLARCLFWLERYEEAEPLFRQALELRRRLLGARHERVAETLCELGDLLVEMGGGKLEAAEAPLAECLAIRRQRFSEPHLAIAEALHNLAWMKDHRRQDDRAAELYDQALGMYRALGGRHPDLVSTLNNYAYFTMRRGDPEQAAATFREALALERQLAPEGSNWPLLQSNLAMALSLDGEHTAAEPLARQASELLRERLGADHWRTAYAEGVLGSVLTGLARYPEAEGFLLRSYGYMEENMGATFYAPQAADRLIALYEAWGRDEAAARYRQLRSQY